MESLAGAIQPVCSDYSSNIIHMVYLVVPSVVTSQETMLHVQGVYSVIEESSIACRVL